MASRGVAQVYSYAPSADAVSHASPFGRGSRGRVPGLGRGSPALAVGLAAVVASACARALLGAALDLAGAGAVESPAVVGLDTDAPARSAGYRHRHLAQIGTAPVEHQAPPDVDPYARDRPGAGAVKRKGQAPPAAAPAAGGTETGGGTGRGSTNWSARFGPHAVGDAQDVEAGAAVAVPDLVALGDDRRLGHRKVRTLVAVLRVSLGGSHVVADLLWMQQVGDIEDPQARDDERAEI